MKLCYICSTIIPHVMCVCPCHIENPTQEQIKEAINEAFKRGFKRGGKNKINPIRAKWLGKE